MHLDSITVFAITCCWFITCTMANDDTPLSEENRLTILDQGSIESNGGDENVAATTLNRQKRTLLLKKKLIGAGLLGFGLGIAKGYKAAYHSVPEVHHVYLSPSSASTKYVEYVEKPIFIERIIERPASVFKPIHVEYRESSSYGSSW